ncbi:MAG: acyloxyacyl hydrolase, partial [Saprospiraceae bacterium]
GKINENMKKYCLLFIFAFIFCATISAQTTRVYFIEPEIHIGKIVPNTSRFPSTSISPGLHLNIGWRDETQGNGWANFYNYPQVGLEIGYDWLGEKDLFGSRFSAQTYIIIPTKKDLSKGVQFKMGIGAAYFNKPYDSVTNPENDYVGSPFTWAFELILQKAILIQENTFKIGFGYVHSSNGHTVLPNYGLNSAVLTLGYQLYPKKNKLNQKLNSDKNKYSDKHFYLIKRFGIGWHELGGPITPIGGDVKPIYSTGLSGGILLRKHILVRTGFLYRYYEQYSNYIKENNLTEYSKNKNWSASNILFFVGGEFLIGHFSMDIEGGLNIMKPFYKTHFEVFEKTNNYDKITKQLIATRLGMNIYLFNTNKLPKHNISVGGYINANFGQADFSELNFNYVLKIK